MSNLKYKIEALLFSSGRRMALEELEKLTKAAPEEIRESIAILKDEYLQRNSSIHIIDDGNSWKLTVKDEHLDTVKQIVTKTELSRSLLETLAVIAFKYPIKQSDLIKLRTNKAYGHLSQLEELEYITRQKYGRTNLIKLAPKFFDYFDLPAEKLKGQFKDFEGIANAIKEKEQEIKTIKKDREKTLKEQHKRQQPREIGLIDGQGATSPLEVVDEEKEETPPEVAVEEERMGPLKVVNFEEGSPDSEEESLGEDAAGQQEPSDGERAPEEPAGVGQSPNDETPDETRQEGTPGEDEVSKRVDAMMKGNGEQDPSPEQPQEPEEKNPRKIEDLDELTEKSIPHTSPRREQKGLIE
ncbi:SMC-Scp complex subunit ScpB [Candidatus Woesearchaeota archaeon]|nr:SMC-Scp complex subunit ScpB [Candidatus Woesearchaeota archaeon]